MYSSEIFISSLFAFAGNCHCHLWITHFVTHILFCYYKFWQWQTVTQSVFKKVWGFWSELTFDLTYSYVCTLKLLYFITLYCIFLPSFYVLITITATFIIIIILKLRFEKSQLCWTGPAEDDW